MWRKVVCALAPRGARLTRRLSDGTVVGGRNREGWGGRGAFVYGDQIEPEFAVLSDLIEPGGVLVDVGANTGIYTLRGARIVGERGTVLALEPNPDMLAELSRNVTANGYHNVRLRGLGAAERCSEFSFWRNHGRPHSFSLIRIDKCSDRFSILTVDIDSLLGWEQIDRFDVLKVDAEGAEDRVLAGAAASIAKHQPVIIAEVVGGGFTCLPHGYGAWRAPDSAGRNNVLLPDAHPAASRLAAKGWLPV